MRTAFTGLDRDGDGQDFEMSDDFSSFVAEQLAVVGPVRVRRMFGGYGIFLDGMMFALIADDVLFFKADDTTKNRYEAEGLEPFTYEAKGGKRAVMSYWRAPERVFDDPDEMRAWAEAAVQVARAAAAKKPASKSKTKTKAKTKPAAGNRSAAKRSFPP